MTRWTAWIARAALLAVVAAAGCSSEHQSSAVAPFGTDTVSVPASVPAGSSPVASADQITVKRLAMVGDSITEAAKPALEKAFSGIGLDDVDINAEGGRRMVRSNSISSGLDAIAEVRADGAAPDVWVIALGTNDVANYPHDQYTGVIQQVLAALPPDAHVVWVDCYLRRYKADAQDFDAVLREVLAARGNAKVVDWYSIAGEDGVLVDGVHPSGFGKDEFSRRIAQTVSDWMA
jgi:lysophospholipase L1-like esterase